MLRAETREAIRDELNQQNNRANNMQLCLTVCLGLLIFPATHAIKSRMSGWGRGQVCLGVAFSMVVEGILPDETTPNVATAYAAALGG